GLGEVLVLVVGIRHRTDRAHAIGPQVALLARVQPHDHHAAVAADDLDVSPGRTGDLAALARLHLDVVADRTDRHLAEQHRVADLGVDALAGDDRFARSETVRSKDVAELAVLILDEGDERRAVRVVLDPLDRGRHVPLATLEVDVAVLLLVTTGHAARGDVALVVATAGLALAFGQRLDRLALVEGRAVDEDQAAARGARRIVVLQCHGSRLRYRW